MVDQIPISINVIIKTHRDIPAIEFRKVITDKDIIKEICWCAFNDKQIIIQPHFTDKMFALRNLKEKKIIYEKNGQYLFN